MRLAALLFLLLAPAWGQYAARRATIDQVDVIQLEDSRRNISVSVAPSIGNIAFEMKVNGRNVLRFPFTSVGAFREKPQLCGVPLLAPWANRLDESAFYANGKKYNFNPGLGSVRLDNFGHPIHGLVSTTSDWQVMGFFADERGAHLTSRLDFSRRPEWIAQFPFAHSIEMTYNLQDGALEVSTRVDNKSAEPMPLALGYHPFFQITDAPRDDWSVGLGAKLEWLLSKELIPTGQTRGIGELVPSPSNFALKGHAFDHVLGDLVRDRAGRATFWVKGKQQKIEVLFGPKYNTAVVYAPAGNNRDLICFEPMTGITDALNLAQRGLYKDLQSVPPGQSWQESFWIRPSGF